MKRAFFVLAIVILVMGAAAWAEDFTLTGYDILDVTTRYTNGYLYDFSTANVLDYGSVYYLYAYNSSTVNMSGGRGDISAHDSSTVNISGGQINELDAYTSSTVNISDGDVGDFYTYDNSIVNISGGIISSYIEAQGGTVNISGGQINELDAYTSNCVNISGGYVKVIKAGGLQRGVERLNISGGTVEKIQTALTLEGDDHFSYTGSVSDFAPYGIQAVEGTIGELSLRQIDAYDSSIVDIPGGSIGSLWAYDSSTVNISDGSMGSLWAYDSSTVNVSGSVIKFLHAYDSSIVNMSGGSLIGYPYYVPPRLGLIASGSSIVNISGGSIDVGLQASDYSTVIFDGYDFALGSGLSWDIDGKTILGTGILTGMWFDNTSFDINISIHDPTATIMAIPEPATLFFLSLGGLLLRKKK